MRHLVFFCFFGLALSLTSCRKDFETVPSSGTLEFSKSKVYLDTIFSTVSSSTYTLKVYNRSNKDISIPSINLGKGASSKFRIMVDGMTGEDADHNGVGDGKLFKNVELLAKDSLYIFIEATVKSTESDADFTYNDKILFDAGSNQQSVDLVTLVQDANFIFPNRPLATGIKEKLGIAGLENVEGHTLTDTELHWTKDKPYVIYGYAAVPAGKTLIIDPGTQVYFHADTYSGLIVDRTASIQINGLANEVNPDGLILQRKEVTFEADRLEPDFEDTPGQWGAFLIFSSNTDNIINHLTLKNATVGLYIQTDFNSSNLPRLKVNNTQIYNCANYGILAFQSNISGFNNVINYCGQAGIVCSEGKYNFINCTFNNNWFSSKQVSVLVNSYHTDNNNIDQPGTVNANFKNCIIYGNNNIQLRLDKMESQPISQLVYSFDHCLIKFNPEGTSLISQTGSLYDFIMNQQQGNIKSQDPKFKNPNRNQFNLLQNSPAIGQGVYDATCPKDILDKDRSAPTTDIGAYLWQL